MATLRKTFDWDGSGRYVAKVYADREWGEFVVKFYVSGVHQVNADHHTIGNTASDKADAYGTAIAELQRMAKRG